MFIRPRRLLDQITLLHGPQDLLGRYFIAADTAARERGIRLRLRTDFEALIALNERHRDSWPALAPVFNPALSNLRIDTAFWIDATDEAGETVATHAARFFDWPDTTLARELRSLRPFYENPAPRISAGESIEVTAPAAERIRGRVMYGGAVWVRPDWRQHGLASLIPRISRAYGYTRWNTEYIWALIEPRTHELGLARANGPYRVEERVVLNLGFRGHLPLLLMWMPRNAMLEDVEEIVDQATVESSRRMETLSTRPSPPAARQGIRRRS
jgi:GNAT superfamily N-acetyltransferase